MLIKWTGSRKTCSGNWWWSEYIVNIQRRCHCLYHYQRIDFGDAQHQNVIPFCSSQNSFSWNLVFRRKSIFEMKLLIFCFINLTNRTPSLDFCWQVSDTERPVAPISWSSRATPSWTRLRKRSILCQRGMMSESFWSISTLLMTLDTSWRTTQLLSQPSWKFPPRSILMTQNRITSCREWICSWESHPNHEFACLHVSFHGVQDSIVSSDKESLIWKINQFYSIFNYFSNKKEWTSFTKTSKSFLKRIRFIRPS